MIAPLYYLIMSKHNFEPADNYGKGGMDSDLCKFKYCNNCGCLKEIWRNGSTFRIGNLSYDKEPECIKQNVKN